MVELGRCSNTQGPWDVPGEGASGGVCVLTLPDFMPAAPPKLIYSRWLSVSAWMCVGHPGLPRTSRCLRDPHPHRLCSGTHVPTHLAAEPGRWELPLSKARLPVLLPPARPQPLSSHTGRLQHPPRGLPATVSLLLAANLVSIYRGTPTMDTPPTFPTEHRRQPPPVPRPLGPCGSGP